MKICSVCRISQDEKSFAFKYKAKKIRQTYCRSCRKSYMRTHYINNKDYYNKKARQSNKRIREQARQYIMQYLTTHPCVDCGETDPVVLEFDHQRDKKNSVSAMVASGYPITTIQTEITKCEVRCCNCHRRKTSKSLSSYRLAPLAYQPGNDL